MQGRPSRASGYGCSSAHPAPRLVPKAPQRAESIPRSSLAALLASVLACTSCGGGSSGDSSSQAPDAPSSGTGNLAPTIRNIAPSQVLLGHAFDLRPLASDPNGDVLTFAIENRPPWLLFDPATGRLHGTPGEAQVGLYSNISIQVSDGAATTSTPPFNIEVVTTAFGTATLAWAAPTQRTDGSSVAVSGYRIYYGTSSGIYTSSVTVDSPGLATWVIEELTPATWYFAVTAIDDQGAESDYSNEALKQIM